MCSFMGGIIIILNVTLYSEKGLQIPSSVPVVRVGMPCLVFLLFDFWAPFFREDVRGVADVAMATPFFQDLFYMPSRLLAISGYPDSWLSRLLTIWSSGHPAFWSSFHLEFWPSGLLAIRPSDHLAIHPSGHPAFWSSGYLVIQTSSHLVIQPSGHPVIWLSGHPTMRSSGHLNFWPSVPMSQKCPYWDIFGLPYCRLHQSQIPNVLSWDSWRLHLKFSLLLQVKGQKDVMSDIPKLSNSREWRSHEKAFLAQWFMMQLVTRKLYTC